MKKFFKEFKEFAVKGNVIDLAIGVIIGGAFTAIVNSLVNDLLMPAIGMLTGGVDISSLSVTVGSSANPATLNYGIFLNAIVSFIIIAICLFLLVKGINKLRSLKKEEPAPEPAPTYICEYCRSEVDAAATKCPHCGSEITPIKK